VATAGSQTGFARIGFGSPQFMVAPTVDLVDGQAIQVSGAHLLPLTRYGIGECGPAQPSSPYNGCDFGATRSVTTDGVGAFPSTSMVVKQVLQGIFGGTFDCLQVQCRVIADRGGGVPDATVLIAFRPPPTAPTAAPSGVSATASGDQISVSYTPLPASASGGSPITKYQAICRSSGHPDQVADDAAGPFGTLVLSGVPKAAAYSCTVRAFNAIGAGPESSASQVIVPDVPSAPTNVAVTVISMTAVSISYTPGSDGLSPILRYEAVCRTAGELDHVAQDTTAPFDAITVDGLTTGAPYSCAVRGVNAVGTGPESPSVSFVWPTAPIAAPTNVAVTPNGPGSVSVSYSTLPDSANGGAPITQYEASCHASGPPRRAQDTSAPFEAITVDGLTPGVTYSCTVQAFNFVGPGPKSAKVLVTVPFTPQAAPTNVQATAVADRQVSVSYALVPDSANGGAAISKYMATCRAPGQPDVTAADSSAPFDPIVVSGLTRGTSYSCSVHAENIAGAGPESTGASVLVPDLPGAPTAVQAMVTADRQITVTYSAPTSNGGAPITRYDVICRASGEADHVASDSSAPFDPIAVSGLTKGVTYSCTARAYNLAGPGPESAAASARVPTPPTAAPTGVQVTVTADHTVSVSYTVIPDSGNGGAPVNRYDAICRTPGQPDAIGSTASAPFQAITVTGLARATTYSCTVRAANLAGAGPESGASQVYVPQPPTAAPTNVLAVPLGFGRARVSYDLVPDSANGGSPITKYEAICRAPGQADRTGEDAAPPFEAIIVSNLTLGVTYSCTVRAWNIAGPGPESSAATVVGT
jgi:titin